MDTTPKPFVFVLMPFSQEFDDVYKLGIKEACKKAGTYCERVDEQIFQESILERIYNQIAKADVVVADMTGRNPNVFYEVGYSHAIGKKVVLITQSTDDIPFDLQHYPHIIYGGKIADLQLELERRVKWYIENPEQIHSLDSADLELGVRGIALKKDITIQIEVVELSRSNVLERPELIFAVDIHNPTERIYEGGVSELCWIVPGDLESIFTPEEPSDVPVLRISDMVMYKIGLVSRLFPGGWAQMRIGFSTSAQGAKYLLDKQSTYPSILKIFSSFDVAEIPFKVEFVRAKERQFSGR